VEELGRQKRPLSVVNGSEHYRLEQSADDQIRSAKIATAALFQELELNAKPTGLQGYRDFLNTIFDGNHDLGALSATCSRVLSFNYERLFEIAFIDHFRLASRMECYGPTLLNSGFDFSERQAVDFDSDRFSFLKLHGSAGMLVAEQHGQLRYGWSANLNQTDQTINDDFFWPPSQTTSPNTKQSPEPLIVFPYEKDRARENPTAFPFDPYIRAIWGQSMKLVEDARQIWVIGYSFDPNDRKSILELLRHNKTNCDIVVQNLEAEKVCAELTLRYSDLAPRLKPFPKQF
jgi:hypothetical protein